MSRSSTDCLYAGGVQRLELEQVGESFARWTGRQAKRLAAAGGDEIFDRQVQLEVRRAVAARRQRTSRPTTTMSSGEPSNVPGPGRAARSALACGRR